MAIEERHEAILALARKSGRVTVEALSDQLQVSRQTIRKIVRGQRHAIFRTRQSSLGPRDRSARSRVERRQPRF